MEILVENGDELNVSFNGENMDVTITMTETSLQIHVDEADDALREGIVWEYDRDNHEGVPAALALRLKSAFDKVLEFASSRQPEERHKLLVAMRELDDPLLVDIVEAAVASK